MIKINIMQELIIGYNFKYCISSHDSTLALTTTIAVKANTFEPISKADFRFAM